MFLRAFMAMDSSCANVGKFKSALIYKLKRVCISHSFRDRNRF